MNNIVSKFPNTIKFQVQESIMYAKLENDNIYLLYFVGSEFRGYWSPNKLSKDIETIDASKDHMIVLTHDIDKIFDEQIRINFDSDGEGIFMNIKYNITDILTDDQIEQLNDVIDKYGKGVIFSIDNVSSVGLYHDYHGYRLVSD